MRTPVSPPSSPRDLYGDEVEPAPVSERPLTSIGRAVVEMAWAGCVSVMATLS